MEVIFIKYLFYSQICKIKNGNVFAGDMNPLEELERAKESAKKTRDAIEQGKPMTLNREGTMLSKNDENNNSLTRHNVSEIKEGNKFAIQWYEKEKKLYEFEYNEMKKAFPQAELSVLKDDRICWNITFNGILDANGNKHAWSFMLIYDSDHPHNRDFGGSIKVYPIKPSMDNLYSMASKAGRPPFTHVWKDAFNNPILCTAPKTQVQANERKSLSAITVASWTASWATHFQLGLTDSRVWAKFNEH